MPNFPLPTSTNHHRRSLVVYRDTIVGYRGKYSVLTSENTAAEIADFLRILKEVLKTGIRVDNPAPIPEIDEFDFPAGTTFPNLRDILGDLHIL